MNENGVLILSEKIAFENEQEQAEQTRLHETFKRAQGYSELEISQKRAAQESFDPEAFMLRRSMPWAEDMNAGLIFVAFGKSFDAFEAVLNRMLGKEDGITDALFNFTRPISGAYFWCPPGQGQ